MKTFDNNDVTIIDRYEAPNVPVTHTPFNQSIELSTHFQQQVVQPVAYNLRAPSINEGF